MAGCSHNCFWHLQVTQVDEWRDGRVTGDEYSSSTKTVYQVDSILKISATSQSNVSKASSRYWHQYDSHTRILSSNRHSKADKQKEIENYCQVELAPQTVWAKIEILDLRFRRILSSHLNDHLLVIYDWWISKRRPLQRRRSKQERWQWKALFECLYVEDPSKRNDRFN